MSKPKFQLTGQRVRITSTNSRKETHGDDKVPAIDVGLEWHASNDALAMFDGRLKAALYQRAKAPPPDAPQGELELPVSDMPCLRFPDLGPIKFNREIEGARLTIRSELFEPIVLADCKVNKFSFECVEGGTTIVRFRVQQQRVGRDESGALDILIDTEVDADLSMRDEQEQGSILAEVIPLGDARREPATSEPEPAA